MEGALVGGALTEEADRNLLGPPQLHGEPETGGTTVLPAANDGDGGEHPDGGVPEVHRATLALADPVRLP